MLSAEEELRASSALLARISFKVPMSSSVVEETAWQRSERMKTSVPPR